MDSELRAMHRLALADDGLRRLLGWLEDNFGGQASVLGQAGAVLSSGSDRAVELTDDTVNAFRGLSRGDTRSASLSGPGEDVLLVTLSAARGAPVLLLSGSTVAVGDNALLGDALRLLDLRWRLDQEQRQRGTLRDAEIVIRESVLHLLMIGDIGGARRVGDTLRPPLPSTVRVYLVEGAAAEREQIALRCEKLLGGSGWIIRCPVYRRHLILLVPTTAARDATDDVEPTLRGAHRGLTVGAGEAVPLRDVPTGYEQAFHALAVARHDPGRFMRFTRDSDVAIRLQPAGARWAAVELDPLLRYLPARPQDPDARDLTSTLRAWLDFRGGAARQLKIHRNTLLARLRHVAELLGVDLDRVPAQARLHLALRLASAPTGAKPVPTTAVSFTDLLDTPAARSWSDTFLGELRHPDNQTLRQTVDAWLTSDAQLEPAAAALRLSVPGVRKRLVRAEQLLGRSLLGAPSARYDLFLALAIQRRTRRGG